MGVRSKALFTFAVVLAVTGCQADASVVTAPSAPPSASPSAAARIGSGPGVAPVDVDLDQTPKHYEVHPGGSVVLVLVVKQHVSPAVPLTRVAALVLPPGRWNDSATNKPGSDIPLRAFEEHNVPADQREFRWTFDAKNSGGQPLPAGTYNLGFVIESVDQQGDVRGTAQWSGVASDITIG